MKLVYHRGKNFGDALNPYIFEQILPDFFDSDDSEIVLGIGSILGLKQHYRQRKIVFSSGYAAGSTNTYGEIPQIDDSWDIHCVRGPLTADILRIDRKFAVADGAILLSRFYNKANHKKHKFSYIPHHTSLNMYSNWKGLLAECDINLIDPSDDFSLVLDEISSSEFIISEAMHGAIAADALRIPWIGVKCYPYINEFKWSDWGQSLNMETNLTILPTLHDQRFFKKMINSKFKGYLSDFLTHKMSSELLRIRENSFIKKIDALKNAEFHLSETNILYSKCDELMDISQALKSKYK